MMVFKLLNIADVCGDFDTDIVPLWTNSGGNLSLLYSLQLKLKISSSHYDEVLGEAGKGPHCL